MNRAQAEQKIGLYIARGRKSLKHPLRMIAFETEMRDRLGLAFQENSNFSEAAAQFEKAFSLNQKLGQNRNLAVNRRSVAYNLYMQAEKVSGDQRKQLLKKAVQNFEAAEKLLTHYGISAGKQKKEKEGLLDISLEVAIDKKGATQAAHGFSLIQEKRLISAFLARINIELGNLLPAEKAIQTQLAEYPLGGKVDDKDLYGVSLLYHRAGLLSAARKKYKDAFINFQYSAQLSHQYENPISTCINVMNMAHVLSGFSKAETDFGPWFSKLWTLEKQAGFLLKSSGISDPIFSARYYNTMGQYMLTIADQPSTDIYSAVNGFIRIQKAILFLNQGIKLLDEGNLTRNREKQALYAVLHLNKAVAASLSGERELSQDLFETALKTAKDNILPDLEWRALTGLGRLEEALTVLSNITVFRAGCRPFEITGGFHALVLNLIQSAKMKKP